MADRPNILFLLSDQHSYRFLSALAPERGGEPCRTPALDRLIESGVYCSSAYCQMALCTPSRTALLTGRHVHRAPVLWPETPTFASHLGAEGYATAAVGKMHLPGARQYAGFAARPYGDFAAPSPGHQKDPLSLPGVRDHIFMPSIIEDVGISDIPESMFQEQFVVRESMAWLREQSSAQPAEPWLLYASFVHPHFPMNAPRRFCQRYWPDGVTSPRIGPGGDGWEHPSTQAALCANGGESQGHFCADITSEQTLRARAAYFACVDHLDEIIGDFLALLEHDGLLDNTIVVYTSDHGELGGEHGLWWKQTWHEASVRVPLIISTPEHRRGESAPIVVDDPVSLGDLFPTLCGLVGASVPEGLDGADLSAVVRGGDARAMPERPGVLVENLNAYPAPGLEYRLLRSARYKYIAFNQYQDLAFDLLEDPHEQRNLLDGAEDVVAEELERMRAVIYANFSFDSAVESMQRERAEFMRRYPSRIRPTTSNQIMRGDGILVEADQPLYYPDIASEDPRMDFADSPQKRRAPRRVRWSS